MWIKTVSGHFMMVKEVRVNPFSFHCALEKLHFIGS